MSHVETLGVLAHHGGLIVDRPEMTVGVVRAISRPTGLELDLLARRPLDRRSGPERQADIRAGRFTPPAPRRLLPDHDEGMDLRIAWLDPSGLAQWQFGGSRSSWSGDHYEGVEGPSIRAGLTLPPLFDRAPVVFAWPEIGFPETVVELPLPDRATVERGAVPIWVAPFDVRQPPSPLRSRTGELCHQTPHIEAGRIIAGPRVLNRAGRVAVVLNRLTTVGGTLSLEILSVAHGEPARAASADAFPGGRPGRGPGAAVAVLHDREAVWLPAHESAAGGGDTEFRCTAEFLVDRPDRDTLTLVIAWPVADLPEVCVDIPLNPA
ncbi:hypothetical protein Aca07nite_38350 [Actinoplanes capillaceus]|uniref:Uncharacterized protein n=1 Tax=Actinoplanes campanulatus TaxID=113559 RepID=A0ABQ3WK26_9ACTN|nr:hypothetical protein [Actinoplanes capillaceus]GID46560.1 hypothetical protein Aca07nite_38350 [Actinoplanes capillaceus]